MADVVNRYRPNFTKGNDVFDALYGTQADELNFILEDIEEIKANTCINTADVKGLSKFEELYYIPFDSSLTREERVIRLLNKVMYKPPITYKRLKEILESKYGVDNVIFEVDYDEFYILVDGDFDKYDGENLILMLREIVPANMYLIRSLPYVYYYLKNNFNYGEASDGREDLSQLTYGELSSVSVETSAIPYSIGNGEGTGLDALGSLLNEYVVGGV